MYEIRFCLFTNQSAIQSANLIVSVPEVDAASAEKSPKLVRVDL